MNLTLLRKVLRGISDGSVSRVEAAGTLGCSERQVNRLMGRYGVQRPPGRMHAIRELAANRRAEKEGKIKQAIAVRLAPDKAAHLAGVSIRTIYRWMEAEGLTKTRKKRAKRKKTS